MSDETSGAGAVEVVLSPGEAARRLEVSPSGLRRLAAVYAGVYGPLLKDSAGTSRIWPQEAVGRLERARALMAAGQARSIKDGLLAVEGGAVATSEAALSLGRDGRLVEALGVVSSQLEAVLEGNRRLEREVEALRSELSQVRQLPAASTVPHDDEPAAVEVEGPFVRAARWLERRLRGGRG